MSKANDDFDDLLQAIADYSRALRAASDRAVGLAAALKRMARRALPYLTRHFGEDLPDELFARRLVSLGAAGTQTDSIVSLWEHYFVASEPVPAVAYRMKCSPRAVHRQLRAFPRNVAVQLWEKNLELGSPQDTPSLHPTTRQQRRIRVLEEEFGLTWREAEVVLAFRRPGRNRGRREIAGDLFITENTLKTHIRNIIHKMASSSMNDAIDNAEPLFKELRRREKEDVE